jgi:bacterioferritin (cytochrome b1)
MSNNIHDTKTALIKEQVESMIQSMIQDNCLSKNELENKYSELFKTSPSLFKFVLKEIKNDNFNKEEFFTNLNKMLDLINKIQKSEVTQHTASEEIGTIFAKKYFPKDAR